MNVCVGCLTALPDNDNYENYDNDYNDDNDDNDDNDGDYDDDDDADENDNAMMMLPANRWNLFAGSVRMRAHPSVVMVDDNHNDDDR